MEDTLALVLAGGHGRRLAAGMPKAAVTLAGHTLLARSLAVVGTLAARCVCVAPAGVTLPCAADTLRVHDAGEGPLAAAVTGAAAWPMPRTLVIAVDLPFVDTSFLVALEREREGAPAVAATLGGVLQPLPVWLDANGTGALAGLHAAGEVSLARALRAIGARLVPAAALPGGESALADVDTPADRFAAERRLAERSL